MLFLAQTRSDLRHSFFVSLVDVSNFFRAATFRLQLRFLNEIERELKFRPNEHLLIEGLRKTPTTKTSCNSIWHRRSLIIGVFDKANGELLMELF